MPTYTVRRAIGEQRLLADKIVIPLFENVACSHAIRSTKTAYRQTRQCCKIGSRISFAQGAGRLGIGHEIRRSAAPQFVRCLLRCETRLREFIAKVMKIPGAVPIFLHKSVGLIPTEKWIGAVAGVELSHPGMRAYHIVGCSKSNRNVSFVGLQYIILFRLLTLVDPVARRHL